MSAIWGHISFSTNDNSAELDKLNKDILSHYSTNCVIDRFHSITTPHFFFGCGIQHFTAESPNEVLPYHNEIKGYYLTCDCVLDNREELLETLSINDAAAPDGTLVALSYERWGIECVKHLRGLFSIAIYDTNSNTLYLATDPVAARCLYYNMNDNGISFSTLLTPLRIIDNSIKINDLYIKDYLTAPGLMPNVISTATPYEDIYLINPGTYLSVTDGKINEHSYWKPDMSENVCNCKTPDEYNKYFRELYEQCVEDAIRTDGEIAIAMSSGLDSATVGAIAATKLQKNNKNLHSYTYVPYEDTPPDKNHNNVHNETEDVKKILAMYPNIVPKFLNNNGKNCCIDLPKSIRVMEIPYKAYANFPNLMEIYQNAHNSSCKVVLCGQMGNLSVSNGYIDNILYDLYDSKHYITFLKYLNKYSKTVKESRKAALKGCLNYFRHASKEYKRPQPEYTPTNPFLSDSILDNYNLQERYAFGKVPLLAYLPTPSRLYHKYMNAPAQYTYLGTLDTKVSLAFGILLRDPTKDMRMLSFCYHLPYKLFAYNGTPRWLVRSSCKDLLPQSLINNWMRYGVQNSDCETRLIRDWDTIAPTLKKELLSDELAAYYDADKVKEFLDREPTLENIGKDILYIMFGSVLYNFIEHSKSAHTVTNETNKNENI